MSHSIVIQCEGKRSSHATLTEALQSAQTYFGRPVTLFLAPGIYRERIEIHQPYLTLEGSNKAPSIITWADGAKEILSDGFKRGTFRTPTIFIDCPNFTARNITFENTAGIGEIAGQALAVYADGNHLLFEHCKFLGRQDTLFTAPLPEKEIEPGGFRGPKEFAPRLHGTHLYRNCYLEGDIDFIFGGATAFFENCEICSLSLNKKINGYITAASTPKDCKDGFVFFHCCFTNKGCSKGSVYLGRPWREFAKVAILNSKIDGHIHPQGWHDWDKKMAHESTYFAEYGNIGEGADMSRRPDWIVRLTTEEADEILRRMPNW